MKALDREGRVFGKINIIDLLIVIFVVLIIGFGVLKVTEDKGSTYVSETSHYKMDLLVRQLYPDFVDDMVVGEEIYDKKTGKYLGILTDKVVTEAVAVEQTEDGQLVETIYPNRYDVVYTIEGEGVYNERTGLMVGDDIRFIGTSVTIKNDLYLNVGYIIDLEVEGVE